MSTLFSPFPVLATKPLASLKMEGGWGDMSIQVGVWSKVPIAKRFSVTAIYGKFACQNVCNFDLLQVFNQPLR